MSDAILALRAAIQARLEGDPARAAARGGGRGATRGVADPEHERSRADWTVIRLTTTGKWG